MGACLIGLHAERMVPLTGTPYNNRLQDMATLCTFIQPQHPSALERWWKDKTEVRNAGAVVKSISDWTSGFMVRRGKEAIESQLPNKTVRKEVFVAFDKELHL
jgi:SNF2 family DNA or RNA helicase